MKRLTLRIIVLTGVLATGAALIVGSVRRGPAGAAEDASASTAPEEVLTTTVPECSCGGSCGGTDMISLGNSSFGSPVNSFGRSGFARDAGFGVAASYCCPKHPNVASNGPGTCPLCHIALVKRQARRGAADTCRCPDCPFKRPAGEEAPAPSTITR